MLIQPYMNEMHKKQFSSTETNQTIQYDILNPFRV
jgi:hypothetical protein